MSEIKVAWYGTNGHQISWSVAKAERAKVVGVADCTEEQFAEYQKEMPEAYSAAKLYPSLDELLEKSGAELISICSARRDEQHLHIKQALEAGMHVYAEKPLATTMDGLETIRAAVESSGRQLRSMTGMPYSPIFSAMKEHVDDGRLGTVVQVFAQKSYPYRDSRPQDRGVDGGLIEQASIHAVSFVRYVTGLEFEEIYGLDTGVGNPKEGDLQMGSTYVARMSSGALCTINANYCNPTGFATWGNDQLRVHGTGGMIEAVDGLKRTMVALGDAEPGEIEFESVKGDGADRLFVAFVDHLLDGKEMLVSQDDSFMNTRVVIRAQESATSGEIVKV